jgi:uracil-DNA glycosylase
MSLKRKASTLPTNDAKKAKADGSITSFFGMPKAVSSALKTISSTTEATGTSIKQISATDASEWDKDAWVKKLSDEQKTLLALEIETMHESWLKVLRTEITSPGFLELKRFLQREAQAGKKIFPPSEDVYSWFVSYPLLPPLFYISGE